MHNQFQITELTTLYRGFINIKAKVKSNSDFNTTVCCQRMQLYSFGLYCTE